jgi:hypothetical protein
MSGAAIVTCPDLAALVRDARLEDLPALAGKLREAELLAEMKRREVALSKRHVDDHGLEDRVLSMDAVAERLGVSLYTARAMGRRGDLPVTTLGRRVGVRESSMRHFLDHRERGGR